MNLSDQELIMRLHDQQTSAEESARAMALIAKDPEAAEYLASISKADEYFNSELDRLLDGPIPDRLILATRSNPGNASTSPSKAGQRQAWLNQPQLALAASIMAALVLSLTAYLQPWQQQNDVSTPLATLMQNALDTIPSGERLADASGQWVIMPTATYRSSSQGLCRQFAGLDQKTPFYGISCRNQSEGRWTSLTKITDSATSDSGQGQTYAPASAPEGNVASYLRDAELINTLEEEQLIRERWQQ
jgi:anti-sigma factor RsiW